LAPVSDSLSLAVLRDITELTVHAMDSSIFTKGVMGRDVVME
jgi:hypothetical protein